MVKYGAAVKSSHATMDTQYSPRRSARWKMGMQVCFSKPILRGSMLVSLANIAGMVSRLFLRMCSILPTAVQRSVDVTYTTPRSRIVWGKRIRIKAFYPSRVAVRSNLISRN